MGRRGRGDGGGRCGLVAPLDAAGQVKPEIRGIAVVSVTWTSALDSPAELLTCHQAGSCEDPNRKQQQDSYADGKADWGSHRTSRAPSLHRPLLSRHADRYSICRQIYTTSPTHGGIAAVLHLEEESIHARVFPH